MTVPSPIRIGIDATGWSDRRGFGRFTRNIVTQLVDLQPPGACVLFVDEGTAARERLPAGATQRRLRLKQPVAGVGGARRPLDIAQLAFAASASRVDVFLFPSLLTYVPVFGAPTVVGLHDTSPEELPELTLPTRSARALWKAKQAIALRRATRLFTVSEAARTTLAERFRLDPRTLIVVPEAPEPVFSPRSEEEIVQAHESVGLRPGEPYLLHAGGMSPHKDLGTLITAVAGLNPPRPKLVLAGEKEGGSYPSDVARLMSRAGELGVEEDVVFPGFVSDETLAGLYSAATAVVVPSLAEGFGLSAVEAAACGAPAVLSDLGPHRESLGDAALYFQPADASALRSVLERVLSDETLRRSLSVRGREAVSGLSWTIAARELQRLLLDVARENGRG